MLEARGEVVNHILDGDVHTPVQATIYKPVLSQVQKKRHRFERIDLGQLGEYSTRTRTSYPCSEPAKVCVTWIHSRIGRYTLGILQVSGPCLCHSQASRPARSKGAVAIREVKSSGCIRETLRLQSGPETWVTPVSSPIDCGELEVWFDKESLS